MDNEIKKLKYRLTGLTIAFVLLVLLLTIIGFKYFNIDKSEPNFNVSEGIKGIMNLNMTIKNILVNGTDVVKLFNDTGYEFKWYCINWKSQECSTIIPVKDETGQVLYIQYGEYDQKKCEPLCSAFTLRKQLPGVKRKYTLINVPKPINQEV